MMDDWERQRRAAAGICRLMLRTLQSLIRQERRPRVLEEWACGQPLGVRPLSLVCAVTLLRKGDAERLNIHDWAYGRTREVEQSKTGGLVKLPRIGSYDVADVGFPIQKYPRDLKSSRSADTIRKMWWQRVGVRTRPGRKSCLHLVRHVFATWAHHNWHSVDEISEELGHETRDATNKYIHSMHDLFTESARKGL
jgi:integrase